MSELDKINYKDFDEMNSEEKQIYLKNKNYIVTNYLGVKTPLSSMKARLQAYLDETRKHRPSFWD
jgi:hypothetical protein